MKQPPTLSPSRLSDEDLLAGIAGGDRVLLGALYDRYSALVFAQLVRIVGSRARAEDLLQEVFLQIWRRAADFRADRGSVSAWLFTIARNRALDLVRSAEHRLTEATAEVPAAAADDDEHPDEQAALAERRAAVRSALGSLSPVQRQAVELAWFEGLSHSEIAARLDEPLGTIKSRLGQAMQRLRACLGEHGQATGA